MAGTGLVDPKIACAVARRVTNDGGVADSYLMERLVRDLNQAVPRSEELVAHASGIPAPPPVAWGVIDRAAWAEANINSMTATLAPLTDRIGRRVAQLPWPVRTAQRALVSAEMGVLVGYISRRVLGQYDVLIPDEPVPPAPERRRRGKVPPGINLYFVGTNMVETERRYGFVPEEFALWVALHEVTHRFQFAGVPWLKERFFGLIKSYLESVQLDARGLAKRLASAATRLASKATPPEEKSPVYLLASEEQRSVLNEIQALMTLVEGHGNFVMDSVGAEVIPSFGRMRQTFERRKDQMNALQRVINQVLGLEMKMRQYELGQRFCTAVAAGEGPAALAHLWADPANLPTLPELQEPRRWLARVA